MNPRIARLRAEVNSDVVTFQSKAEELRGLPNLSGAGRATLAQAAVALHHGYGALESALARIARAIDDGLPEGPDWHQALLHVMNLPIESVRPAVLSDDTYALLQRLLGFRHFFRHAYAIDWDGARLDDLRASALAVLPLVSEDLRRFDKFLAEAGSV